MLRLLQPPGPTQINNAKSLRHGFGHQRTGGLVRSGQKKKFHTLLFQALQRKRLQGITTVAGKRRENVREIYRSLVTILATEQGWLRQSRVMQKQPRQFEAGIASGSYHRGLEFRRHHASIS